MNRVILVMSVIAFIAINGLFADESIEAETRIDSLEKQTTKLEKDVENLKREMHQLRRLLAGKKVSDSPVSPGIAKQVEKPSQSIETESADCDTCYWCTKSGKRHNSNCKYYKTTKGRPCGPDDGVACKLCGG